MEIQGETILNGKSGELLEAALSPLVQATLSAYALPGLAIGVVADGAIAYARGFGVQRLGSLEPVTARTLFHMASISKPFVATAIMQLVERGKMQLDDPLVAFLPYFKLADDRYKVITIRQMLHHVSGMPDVLDYEWDDPQYDAGALERYVRSLTGEELLWAPGEKFAYSNMAFECLGEVVAKVSGMSFDDYVKMQILNPACMPASTFLKPDTLPEGWATPHLRLLRDSPWEGYPYHRAHGPSSTLHSNALEMCNWALINLKRGSLQGNQILQPASCDLLWQPWGDAGGGRQIGLSWFISEHRGERAIQHGGGDTGFATYLILLPERQAAVVVLCNTIPAPVWELALSALDILLGVTPDPILPPASLVARQILLEQGMEPAAVSWFSLQAKHPHEYDFSSMLLDMLFEALTLERVVEAEQLAHLCARIYPQAEVIKFADFLSKFRFHAVADVLKALQFPAGSGAPV